jgi:type VI secretion system protein ImpC
MAKRKDDVSFTFSNQKFEPKPEKKKEEVPTDTPATDPFASTDSSDPFASAQTPAADPFAGTDTPSDTSTDPFATSSADASSTETPPEGSADETPAEETPAEEEKSSAPAIRQHKQFRILVLADFSGRTNRSLSNPADMATRKVRTVDADSLDKTLAALKPSLALPVDEKTVMPLTFKAMGDFRPDSLLQQVEAFQGMLKLRSRLQDARTFKEAAAAVRTLLGMKPPQKAQPAAAAGAQPMSDFEELLNKPGAIIAPRNAAAATADALIANLVGGYGVPDADPQQAQMVKLVEDALSAGLRAVLRHPAFQALEGAWRGVEFLVSRLNTDEDLKICIFDVSRDELYADLSGQPTIQKSGMYQILVEQTRSAGAVPFSLVIGDYAFDQTPQSVALLAKIAALMHEAKIPFIAAGTAEMPGFASFAKAPDSGKWNPPADLAIFNKLRAHKLAVYLGLTAPRFLLRLPYGPKTDAIDTYPFNEMPDAPVSEQYLWGNGAFAVALLIGQAFLDNGWGAGGGIEPGNDVSDLPCHMAVVEGDKEMTPCAEGWLSDRVGDILHQLGLIPLLSVRNSASVKVAGIHSIVKGKPLAAFWATS